MDAKARIIQLIDDKQQEFIECSDAIWAMRKRALPLDSLPMHTSES